MLGVFFLSVEMDKKVSENFFTRVPTVQDLIQREIFEESQNSNNEMLELIEHVQRNGISLTDDQIKAWFLLKENGLEDIAMYMNAVRPMATPVKLIFDLINKITMADRIKGTAKLDKILKAQVASPSGVMPNANDVQAKALKEKELGR
jgi:hypothetical protein